MGMQNNLQGEAKPKQEAQQPQIDAKLPERETQQPERDTKLIQSGDPL